MTVDIARELGALMGVSRELVCFDAARKSFEAMTVGRANQPDAAVAPPG